MTEVQEEEPLFSVDKKKKKKKIPGATDGTTTATPTEDIATTIESTAAPKEKKSSSKSKSVAFAAGEVANENKENPSPPPATSTSTSVKEDSSTTPAASSATGGGAGGDEEEDGLNLLQNKKKKKKKPTKDSTAGETEPTKDATATGGDEATTTTTTTTDSTPIQGEYTYDDLLLRVFNIIKEKNPNLNDTDKIRLTLKPPQVDRIGTKRTSFSNFGEICKSLKRQEKHLHQYLLAELGTNGSIDANNALTIKGRFQQKQIESVLRSYIKEYVICKTCRSPDTSLQKEERLTVLLCSNCRSRYFVTGIKTGFQAQVGKRAATRAKTTT